MDLFDGRDGALALEVARAVVDFADQQLGELAGPPGSRTACLRPDWNSRAVSMNALGGAYQ